MKGYLPCPFCGCTTPEVTAGMIHLRRIQCPQCHAIGPPGRAEEGVRENALTLGLSAQIRAVAGWNMRDGKLALLELGDGYEQGDPGWYISDRASGLVVCVIDDDVALTRAQAEAVLRALEAAR